MKYLLILLGAILGLSLLLLIDHKIKGSKSIIRKVVSVIFVSTLIFGCIVFYGETILEMFHVDMKSFSNIKAFFSSRIIAILAIFLMFMFVLLKTIRIVISFRTDRSVVSNKKEALVVLLSVVFDIAVIPNIIALDNTFLVVAGIISMIGTGLACIKLVFSYFNRGFKEALA